MKLHSLENNALPLGRWRQGGRKEKKDSNAEFRGDFKDVLLASQFGRMKSPEPLQIGLRTPFFLCLLASQAQLSSATWLFAKDSNGDGGKEVSHSGVWPFSANCFA